MIDPLKRLTKNEAAVLFYKCKGLKRPQIAIRLDYSEDWVQLHMSSVYTKLGFDKTMHWTKRVEILDKEICPKLPKDLKDWDFTEEIEQVEEPTPDPEMMALVLYDEQQVEKVKESSLIPPKPKEPIVIIDREKEDKWRTFRRVFFVVVSLIIVSGVGYYAYKLGVGNRPAPDIVVITATFPSTPESTATSAIPTDTLIPTNTPTTIPTNTQVPTNTSVATEFVPPADGILFQDNFDSGDISAWNQNSGQWIVLDGKLTKLYDEKNYDYQWISLGRPEWKNYILSIDVYQPYSNNFVIAVRNNSSKSQLIGLNVNHEDINLVLVSDNYQENSLISASTEVEIPLDSKVNIQLEVQGDTYILTSNGREVQRVTLPGYESGGISIGSVCFQESYGCTKFDNVKVTYLP